MVSDPQEKIEEELLTYDELAPLLKCTRRTLERMVQDGCPHARIGKRGVRFFYSEVIDWMKQQARKKKPTDNEIDLPGLDS